MALLFLALMQLPIDFQAKLASLQVTETQRILIVQVKEQKLTLFEGGTIKNTYDVSTALKGIGQELNTYQTPLGWHRINQMVGKAAPLGAIFDNRIFKGEIWKGPIRAIDVAESKPVSNTDLITSRILWLEGIEPGFNAGNNSSGVLVDSYKRFIYIHGTNHEDDIGKPTSRGCIRMHNAEVIELFDKVSIGDLVLIVE